MTVGALVALGPGGIAIAGALEAVGSVAVGAAIASAGIATFQKGKFFDNMQNNFHQVFRISCAVLIGEAVYGFASSGGEAVASGGNGYNGYVRTFGAAEKGITIGPATWMDSSAVYEHELGHTIHFFASSLVAGYANREGASGNPVIYTFGLNLAFGLVGIPNLGNDGGVWGFKDSMTP